jgi:Zn-dependent protease
MFDFPLEKIRGAIVFLITLVLSICVHEYGHALSADKLGDRTPRSQGRVTLNPLAHIDPIGTLVMPLVIYFSGWPLLGWGKPVYVNPLSFSRRFRMKTAHLIVAAFGPLMNVILALFISIIFTILWATHILSPMTQIGQGFLQFIALNWTLVFFNLIPLPPLDGGTVLAGLLPDKYDNVMQFLRQYGFLILIGLMFTHVIEIFLKPVELMLHLTFSLMQLVIY